MFFKRKSILFLFIFVITICSNSILDTFSKQSIYLSLPKNTNINNNPEKTEIEYSLLKLEERNNNFKGNINNHMSLFISSKYYHNLICLDPNDKSNFYTLKNTVHKHVSTFHYKISDSYTIIKDKNHYCFERLEYVDENLNLEEKNIFINKNYWYNLINSKSLQESPAPLIEEMTNINFSDIQKEIKSYYNKFSNWNKDNSFELVFLFDTIKNKFILQKIFIYYINNETKSNLMNLKSIKFNNIIIEHQNKFYKDFALKEKLDISNIPKNNELNLKITTNKKDSVYHNLMSISLNDNIIDNYYKKYSQKNNENLCYFIHYILTEDVYIERNEFMKRFLEFLEINGISKEKLKTIRYYLHASKFIEQELSSDLSEQAFFSFLFCANKEILSTLKNNIDFTIHFRYQPSLKANSTLTHQTVVMPQPFFYILPGNVNNSISAFFNSPIYKNNVFENLNENKLFEEEVKAKKLEIFNQVGILNNNYKELIHKIPAGQMKYFWNVTIITSITSFLGFLLIMYGVMQYISDKDLNQYVNKKKSE